MKRSGISIYSALSEINTFNKLCKIDTLHIINQQQVLFDLCLLENIIGWRNTQDVCFYAKHNGFKFPWDECAIGIIEYGSFQTHH